MAIKNIIAQGIGFNPGSIKYIPTLGFDIATLILPTVRWTDVNQGRLPGGMGLTKSPFITRRY